VNAVQDNSCELRPGALFVAIAGELTDGHRYILPAVPAGAAALCVQRDLTAEERSAAEAAGCGCLRVAGRPLRSHASRSAPLGAREDA